MANPNMNAFDLTKTSLREVNAKLQSLPADTNEKVWHLNNLHGEHACAVGLTQPIEVHVNGHIGYYCAGMNQKATVVIHGQCGVGVAENMMSGEVRVKGTASSAAGATGQGGMLVIEGDADALRHFHEGHRYRRQRLGRRHERLHGPERRAGRVR